MYACVCIIGQCKWFNVYGCVIVICAWYVCMCMYICTIVVCMYICMYVMYVYICMYVMYVYIWMDVMYVYICMDVCL